MRSLPITRWFLAIAFLSLFAAFSALTAKGQEPVENESARIIRESLQVQYAQLWESMSPEAKRGYKNLVGNVYLPFDFDEEVLIDLDRDRSPLPLVGHTRIETPRGQTFARYGLSPRIEDPTKPLQYVVSPDGHYAMNCFACHGGNLFGITYPGAPNTTYVLESLTESVRKTKLRLSKPMAHMDIGSLVMPLGTNVGTSNAVMFGVALMNYRDKELNVHVNRAPAQMTHHDMDAPPWWHFHRKHHIYIDGFAQKGHKGLMQFMLVRQNGPEKFKNWESDFRDVYAFLSELRPPKYPLPIDQELAAQGKRVFEANCASCHGTYGNESLYPERNIPIDEIGTDRVRFDALTATHRSHYGGSWFADFGGQETFAEVDGYVAPPLDGIWASAPYLHNGSVPTLWHLLNPESRPVVWRRTHLGLDIDKMGFQVEELGQLPPRLKPAEKRHYFSTSMPGKSAKGHDYPSSLTDDEKRAVLEYLKTL
jgi:mono/diheme cytochrome c family protein